MKIMKKRSQNIGFLPIALSLMAAFPQRTEDWLRFRNNRKLYIEFDTFTDRRHAGKVAAYDPLSRLSPALITLPAP